MTNGIDKKALFNLKSEPYLKPISDLGVGFYNLDENTAILRFQLSNTKGPLLIHENNLTAYAYFESDNGSASDVIELEIEDSNNGIVTITLDKEFLHASTSTKVEGQIYIGVNNVSGKPEYNEVAVLRKFSFEVADALINKISATTKIEYIRMFSQLKQQIEKRVNDIEAAIAAGADYVAEMEATLLKGKTQLTKIVTDGNSSINGTITQAKADVKSVVDSATSSITTLSNNTKSSLQNTADVANADINKVSDAAVTHVDTKVAEFNQTVLDNGFVTPEKLAADLDVLDWQKYKLTNDDGGTPYTNLSSNIDELNKFIKTGFYYVGNVPGLPSGVSSAGFLNVYARFDGNIIKQIYHPYYQSKIIIRHYYNGWSNWEELTNIQTDTGWIPYNTINGVEKNSVYKTGIDNGFDCAYRIVKNGDVIRRTLRVNAKNLTQGVNFAELPSSFSKHTQVMSVRTPRDLNGGLVEIKPDGKLIFQYYKASRDWVDTDYIYGEFSWVE